MHILIDRNSNKYLIILRFKRSVREIKTTSQELPTTADMTSLPCGRFALRGHFFFACLTAYSAKKKRLISANVSVYAKKKQEIPENPLKSRDNL